MLPAVPHSALERDGNLSAVIRAPQIGHHQVGRPYPAPGREWGPDLYLSRPFGVLGGRAGILSDGGTEPATGTASGPRSAGLGYSRAGREQWAPAQHPQGEGSKMRKG